MNARRPNQQMRLPFEPRESQTATPVGPSQSLHAPSRPPFTQAEPGETRSAPRRQGVAAPITSSANESPASSATLMETICNANNLTEALRRVIANKGAAGVDGMTARELADHWQRHGLRIVSQLLSGTYKPAPVKRVEIPKPDGGVRKLGIPTVLDRMIQQALLQVLQPLWEPTFSEHSYGFRPGRSAHQAVAQAQVYITAGRSWVVDIDLEKFFDRVNHDKLMRTLYGRIADPRVLKLLRAYLNAGVMENRRGHAFVRYADDCNIYVRSETAGQRVMESVSDFIARRLKLKVNQSKSAVDRPSKRKFLGFTFSERRPRCWSPGGRFGNSARGFGS